MDGSAGRNFYALRGIIEKILVALGNRIGRVLALSLEVISYLR